MPKLEFNQPKFLPTEGKSGLEALCGLSRHLGYKDPFHQLMNADGSAVGDLICFLEDNPGAIKSIYNWIDKEFADKLNPVIDEEYEEDLDSDDNHTDFDD